MGVRTSFLTTSAVLLFAIFGGAPLAVCGQKSKTSAADGTGAYATGHYRNLLAEAGHTDAEINARLVGQRIRVTGLTAERPSLEQVVLNATDPSPEPTNPERSGPA